MLICRRGVERRSAPGVWSRLRPAPCNSCRRQIVHEASDLEDSKDQRLCGRRIRRPHRVASKGLISGVPLATAGYDRGEEALVDWPVCDHYKDP